MQDALLDAARFWLDRGVDGFRCDAINFSMHDPALTDNPPLTTTGKRTRPFDFQDKIHNQSQPDILELPEPPAPDRRTPIRATGSWSPRSGATSANEEMKLYTAGRRPAAFRLWLPLSLRRQADDRSGRSAARRCGRATEGEGWPSWTFSNHDAPRAVSRWAEGRDPKAFAEMALLLLMCLRGNVFVYQGEELGLPQAEVPFERLVDPEAIANWPETLGRDGARTPMPWKADNGFRPASRGRALAAGRPAPQRAGGRSQERDPGSTLHLARRLIALRKAHPALRTGVDDDAGRAGRPAGVRADARVGETPALRLQSGPCAGRLDAARRVAAGRGGQLRRRLHRLPGTDGRPDPEQAALDAVSRRRSRARSGRWGYVRSGRRPHPRDPAVWRPSAGRPSWCPGRWSTGPGARSG